jgi:hypothetical protein
MEYNHNNKNLNNSFEINMEDRDKLIKILSISQNELYINTKDFNSSSDEDYNNLSGLSNTITNENNMKKNIFDHDITILYNRSRHKNLPYKKGQSNINVYYLNYK